MTYFFNYILPPTLAQDTYLDIINILYLSHRVPPDPGPTRIIKLTINVDSQQDYKPVYSIHHSMIYEINQRSIARTDFLIDRGTNGLITDSDVRVLETNNPQRHVNVRGINNHKFFNIFIVFCTGVIESQKNFFVFIMHQYTYIGKDYSIHVSSQFEYYGNIVNDKIKTNNNNQYLIIVNNYIINFVIRSGLVYIDIRFPTNAELYEGFIQFPQIIFISDLQ